MHATLATMFKTKVLMNLYLENINALFYGVFSLLNHFSAHCIQRLFVYSGIVGWCGLVTRGAWTCGYAYRAVHIGTSLSMCKGASGHCKVYRGLYVGTSSMFLNLALCIPLVSSFGFLSIAR